MATERRHWKILDTYGCELERFASLKECKAWLRTDEQGRKSWVHLRIDKDEYEADTIFGKFIVTKRRIT